MVCFGVVGKFARLYIGKEALQGFGGGVGQVGVLAHEAGEVVGVHSKHVVEDENLAVAVATRADADGGNGNLVGDGLGQHVGDAFEDKGENSGIGQGARVFQQFARRLETLAL